MRKTILSLIVIVAIVLAGWLVFGRSGDNNVTTENNNNTGGNQSSGNNNETPSDTDQESTDTDSGDGIAGILRVSDNQSLGNLMIVTEDHTVYLHTSRDFSALVGKNVVVQIEGNLQSFTLIDIKPQE